MTTELFDGLLIIMLVAIASSLLGPVFAYILPNRAPKKA